jgi:hypothetical protein
MPSYAEASEGEGGAGGIRTRVRIRKLYALYMLSCLQIVGQSLADNSRTFALVAEFRTGIATLPALVLSVRHPVSGLTEQRPVGCGPVPV